MKIRRMLVAVDFTAASLEAARWAVRHVGGDAELVLLHVIMLPESPSLVRGRYAPSDELRRTAVEGARLRLRELGESLAVPRFSTEVRIGDPAREIADVAASFQADMVVLGPHKERGRFWEMLGGTADALVRLMPVPTLLAPAGSRDRTERIIAAVDGGRLTDQVLETAAAFARRAEAELIVLHAQDPAAHAALSAVHCGDEAAIRADALAETRFMLEAPMRAAGLDPETARIVLEFGEPRLVILHTVERLDADFLVLGTHGLGRHAITHALGSVASSVLRKAPVPILVVNGRKSRAGASRPLDSAPRRLSEFVPWH